MANIVTDEAIRFGKPRIEGTRITVLDIKRRVVDGDEDPFAVAAEYELDAAAVFTALAYYYDNVEAMQALEAEQEDRQREIRRESRSLRDRLEDEPTSEEA
ncbi:DUF433 domain-containing protein [Haloglomus irregulare]|jgi:uncharacterized protein (DUF433 family)|uniref:DUF433 domain-containing protein n=1 Tax=Haloglomus irregulare TaxID=2234134 RepID=A0A554NFR3_9EURY|nr:DUF433 domain-containing protein [Haloglomus irregulare]TSD16232.1 DUF433 domain-containing protein [Haloglomus irregulare]